MKRLIPLLLLQAFLLLSGCTNRQPRISTDNDISFKELVEIDDLNFTLTAKLLNPNGKSADFNSDIRILVENTSIEEVFLHADTSQTRIRVFILRENNWLEIQDAYVTYGDGNVLNAKGQMVSEWRAWVRPVNNLSFGDSREREIVRVLVTGEMMSDGDLTGIPVGAYVDLFVYY